MIRKIFTLTSALFLLAFTCTFSQERGNIHWTGIGPTKYSGELKSGNVKVIMTYKNNPSQLVAGTTTGGLWFSTNDGADWSPSTLDFNANNISCGAQGSDGVMYFGTGSYDTVFNVLQPLTQIGKGIYKSTDGGKNFTLLASTIPSSSSTTVPFAFVNKISIDPENSNNVYAATNNGLYRTTDGGGTWNPLITNDANMAFDVEVGKSGFVLASVRSRVYMSMDGTNFTKIDSLLTTSSTVSLYKVKLVISQVDNNYAYIATMTANPTTSPATIAGSLGNIYKTTNKGATWSVMISGVPSYFEPFNGKGGQSSCFGLYPDEKEKLFIGGFALYAYTPADGWSKQLSGGVNNGFINTGSFNSVAFNKELGYAYFATRKGIFRSPKGGYNIFPTKATDFSFFTFLPYSKGISSSDVYDIIVDGEYYFSNLGENGLAISKAWDPTSNSLSTKVSTLTTLFKRKWSLKIVTVGTYGDIQYTVDGGVNYASGLSVFESRQLKAIYKERYISNPNIAAFAEELAPVSCVETYRNGKEDYQMAFCVKSDVKRAANNTLSIVDSKNSFWVSRNVLDGIIRYTAPSGEERDSTIAPLWYRIAHDSTGSPIAGRNVGLETTNDLNIIYAAMLSTTSPATYTLFRLKGINGIYDSTGYTTNDTLQYKKRVSVTKIANFGSRAITSINVDPNHPGHLIVTLGGFGFTENVYRTSTADVCVTANDLSNFELVQGDLVSMPIFDAVIDVNDSDRVLLATYDGVKICNNAFTSPAANLAWVDGDGGVIPEGTVVNKITQDACPCPWEMSKTGGLVMASTMGKGGFVSTSFVGTKEITSIKKKEVSIYPNPTSNSAFVSFVNGTGITKINILDINGRVVFTKNVENQTNVEVNTSTLQSGTYFVNVSNNKINKTEKLVVIR